MIHILEKCICKTNVGVCWLFIKNKRIKKKKKYETYKQQTVVMNVLILLVSSHEHRHIL